MIMSAFTIAADAIDPSTVPVRTTARGDRVPAIGLGTFGSDHASPTEVAAAVREAIALGYRHIDCARVYGNEAEIGEVFAEVLDSGLVRREELWVTTKFWNDMHGDGDVMLSLAQIDRNCRLIKGQVFLWPGSSGWEDLWDPDGVIPG